MEKPQEKATVYEVTENPVGIDINRVSSLTKLLRVTDLVVIVVKIFQKLFAQEHLI